MTKVIGFIDGFNLYHAIMQTDKNGNQPYAKYRWLDYRKLIEGFLEESDVLEDVYYFSAHVSWDSPAGKEKRERHQTFITAQKDRGVKVILGRFRPVWKTCMAACKKPYQTYEEKRTDVNIAVTMLKLAFLDQYQKAILISGDSDMIPALEAVKEVRPLTKIMTVIPIERKGTALSNASHLVRHMKESHLKKCLLPYEIALKNGVIVNCPLNWR